MGEPGTDADFGDVFALLAGSGCRGESEDGDDSADGACDEEIQPPLATLGGHSGVLRGEAGLRVETVSLADVLELRDERFNSTNHHEWAPFRSAGDSADADATVVDARWWASLHPEQRAALARAAPVSVAGEPVAVPHAVEIKSPGGCRKLYHAYVDSFAFACWRHLRPEAQLVPLGRSDRRLLERISRRRVLGGSGFQDADLAELGGPLLDRLGAAIRSVGGRAFAKTAEKSAKNDLRLRAHETPASVIAELTSSADVLQQSLGSEGRAKYLVVQPWDDRISRANEFRVIVVDRRVVGITQQSWSQFVGHTAQSAEECVQPLLRWWYEVILPECPYSDCVLDAFVADGAAHLIEVNPCGFWGSSGSGLFHWLHDRELLLGGGPVIVRVVVQEPDAARWI